MAYIYLIEFPNHPNLCYVGKTTRIPATIRIREHFWRENTKSKTDKLCRWYKKNNIETINTILEETDINNVDYLEVFWIRYMKYLGFQLTNHHDNETISISWTDERKKKHSENKKNFKFEQKSKDKMSKSKMGMKVTWGDKISQTKKGIPNPFSETHLANLRIARKKSHGRAITQMDLDNNVIKDHNMIIDAAIELIETTHSHMTLNGLKNGIKDCCVGKQFTAGGFKWKYKENLEN
jgi:hypothetical protein